MGFLRSFKGHSWLTIVGSCVREASLDKFEPQEVAEKPAEHSHWVTLAGTRKDRSDLLGKIVWLASIMNDGVAPFPSELERRLE